MKDIAFHITDIAENSLMAGSSRVEVSLMLKDRRLTMTVADNGCGMTADTVRRAANPFYTTRTTRNVGLGLPFLAQNAEQTGGSVEICSAPGDGTTVTAVFVLDHIDCPPMGDLAATLMQLIAGNQDAEIVVNLMNNGDEFSMSSSDFIAALDGIPLGHPQGAEIIKRIITLGIDKILSRSSEI